MRTGRFDQRGSALVVSLFTLTTLVMLGTAFLTVTTSSSRRQAASVDNLQAFYIAEAGLAEAFQAVRMGRSGQIGFEHEPASFGDGFVWVNALETADDQVRLEAVGLFGNGRASLAYVLEAVELPLGFFGDEEVIVESVLLVDGFDSAEAPYVEVAEEKLPEELIEARLLGDRLIGAIGRELLEAYLQKCRPLLGHGERGARPPVQSDPGLHMDRTDDDDDERSATVAQDAFDEIAGLLEERSGIPLGGRWRELVEIYDRGLLFADQVPLEAVEGDLDDPFWDVAHTDNGGVLGSNGDVRFMSTDGQPVAVFGDIRPGPDGTILGLDGVYVDGITDPRSEAIDLPEVDVPDVEMEDGVRQSSPLPMLISGGTRGIRSLEVESDAEFVIRGPATLVVGDLVLRSGASLTLDTRDGDVALYITEGMDLEPDSSVQTTAATDSSLTVQVAAIPSDDEAAVQLEATSQFHGTVYAPEADVAIGGDFEVFGGVIARKLEIGSGAKLHFDNAWLSGTPIPEIVCWRIEEVPDSVRGGAIRHMRELQMPLSEVRPLAASHELRAVAIRITYIDRDGLEQTYSGPESGFDWMDVQETLTVERQSSRPREGAEMDGTRQSSWEWWSDWIDWLDSFDWSNWWSSGSSSRWESWDSGSDGDASGSDSNSTSDEGTGWSWDSFGSWGSSGSDSGNEATNTGSWSWP